MLISLLLIAGLTWYVMTPPERERVVRAVARSIPRARVITSLVRRDRDELLDKMLRQRTPWPIVTPAVALLNVALFWWMGSDPAVPLAEGFGNFGPKTTNGEWWRLATAMFVHVSVWQLVVNMTAFVQVGLVLERLVGSVTFAGVYLTAGVFSGLAAISTSPGEVTTGASGAVFGLYGLLIASWMWGTFQRAEATVRLRTIKRLAPVAFVFSVAHLATKGNLAAADCMGVATGFVCGVMTARTLTVSKPPLRRLATTLAAAAYLAIVAAVPLRGLSDVKPALTNVAAIEARTAAAYETALKQFRNGRIDRGELAEVIERKVLPQLQVAQFELRALDRPPRPHLPLVQAAEIYTIRRIESWKVRARALRTGDSEMLRAAESIERAALDRLRALTG
jgi:rhomboid protease GluP